MSSPLEYRVAELERRLLNIARVATIIDVDYEKALVKVKDGELETKFLPWLTQRANAQEISWDAPEIGERVLLVSPAGNTEIGIVIPALYCSDHPAVQNTADIIERQHSDEAIFRYDRDSSKNAILLPEDGTHFIKIGEAEFTITKDTLRVKNGAMTLEGESLTVKAPSVTFDSNTVTLKASAVNLGGEGGKKVARVGDAIDTTTKKIIGGSNVTKSS